MVSEYDLEMIQDVTKIRQQRRKDRMAHSVRTEGSPKVHQAS